MKKFFEKLFGITALRASVMSLKTNITTLKARVEELEKPNTFMSIDLGWNEPTQVVIMQKGRSPHLDRVEIINLSPKTELADVRDMVVDLMARYGIKTSDIRADAQPGFKASVLDYARRRGLK